MKRKMKKIKKDRQKEEDRRTWKRRRAFMRRPAGSARQKFFQLQKSESSLIPRASIFIAKRVT